MVEKENMKDQKDLESKFLEILDNNIRLIQYSVYAIGVVGLGVVARSARIFTKFTSAGQVPQEFITKSVRLHGEITGIEVKQLPTDSMYCSVGFQVEHTPVISLRLFQRINKLHHLKVELAGVQPTREGVNWMTHQLESNSTIWLKLYGINEERTVLHSSVLFKRSWRQFWRTRDLAVTLLKKNLASVAPYNTSSQSVQYNQNYPKYYRKLLHYEAKFCKT